MIRASFTIPGSPSFQAMVTVIKKGDPICSVKVLLFISHNEPNPYSAKDVSRDCIHQLFIELWHTNGKSEILSLKAYIFTAFKFQIDKINREKRQESKFQG